MADTKRTTVRFTVFGQECQAPEGAPLIKAAQQNGITLPFFCAMKGINFSSPCLDCALRVNGRPRRGCYVQVSEGMIVEKNLTEEEENKLRAELYKEKTFVNKEGGFDLEAAAAQHKAYLNKERQKPK